jgi:predicted anti-sigma-YlaC factor YlaD
MNCEIFREMVGSYVDETLEEDRRQWFRHHLRECASCRESALKQEPSLIFATTTAKPAAAESVDACVAAITARIRQDRFEHRLHNRRRPWMAAAAAAVMVVSGGLVWRTIIGDEKNVKPAVETAQDLEAQISPPTVEVEMAGEEVRVYQFATDGDTNTAVYFIVDPALEL